MNKIEEFWSDDFAPLQFAGKEILQALRDDEQDADLYRKLTTSGSHAYVINNDDNKFPSMKLKHTRSVPIPSIIKEEAQKAKAYTFMGLLGKAGLAWMSVDHKVFVWSIYNNNIMAFTNPREQPVIAVGLVKPKKGVFTEEVEWCVVISTPEEVILCALKRFNGRPASITETKYELHVTKYILPTDGKRILSIAGNKYGQIFMGADDGCLYEMNYESYRLRQRTPREELEAFYDSDSPDSQKRKSSNSHLGPRKCRKLNRSTNIPAVLGAIVPDFVSTAASFAFGGNSAKGSIRQVVVDDDRHCVYTLSTKGWICAFDTTRGEVQLKAEMETIKLVRMYLNEVSRGKMFPSSQHIIFPGGGSTAQAGVGGMEGARSLVKLADRVPETLLPVALSVVSPTESSRLTLMAVTQGGLRLYISSLSSSLLTGAMRHDQLRPSGRLSLLHVRSTPPGPDARSVECLDVAGAVTPAVNREMLIHSAYHDRDTFVVAKARKQGPGLTETTGSSLLSAIPDLARRKDEIADLSIRNEDSKKSKKLIASGGITEILTNSDSAILIDSDGTAIPGGIIWSIDGVELSINAAQPLVRHSMTPSDADLTVGLPPPFNPKQPNQRSTESRDLVTASSLTSSAHTILGDIVRQYIFRSSVPRSRPIGSVTVSNGYRFGPIEPTYRLSGRDASTGFSSTAVESRSRTSYGSTRSSSKGDTTLRSARLRASLLQPPPVPLGPMASQLWESRKEVVAINAGGIHFYSPENLLGVLSNLLLSSGDNAARDPRVKSFFECYGYEEGCAMCLSLAVGFGGLVGTISGESVRRKAVDAVMEYGLVPRLKATTSDSNMSRQQSLDSFVPDGFDFQPSSLYKGLVNLSSRLLRPLLHKPLVVVTEGRHVRSHSFQRDGLSPAKVELLLTAASVSSILPHLKELKTLMRRTFARAVEVVPGKISDRSSMMDLDEPNSDRFISKALQYQNQFRNSKTASQLSPREAENLAHLVEEKNIHSLYRFVSRAVQVIRLMMLLEEADAVTEIPRVKWGLLHGLTADQLIESEEGQDRVESLLNALLTESVFGRAENEIFSHKSDQIARSLADECYHFFSPSSRFLYLALKTGNEAVSLPATSAQRGKATEQVASHLRSAAEYWRSAALVTGRMMHAKQEGKYFEMARQARQNSSPLARATDCLAELGDVATLVEICLKTAENFGASHERTSKDQLVPRLASLEGPSLRWEDDLYHYRRSSSTVSSAGVSTTSPMRSPGNSYGTSVTSQDAIDVCYALIFDHLSSFYTKAPALADQMASCCAYSSNKHFLAEFFQFLVQSEYQNVLLRIKSDALESWLEKNGDFDLLIRYLSYQGKDLKSGRLSYQRANETTTSTPLRDRLDYLSRADSSFKAAFRTNERDEFYPNAESLSSKIKEVEESVRVARLQRSLLSHIPPQAVGGDVSESDLEKLKTQLLSVSELYNDFAVRVGLWGDCLKIIHECRHDEPGPIELHWRSIFAEELLPCSTRERSTYDFLEEFFAGLNDSPVVEFLEGNMSSSFEVFEDGRWARRLEEKITALGSQLYGTGFDPAFPVNFLLFALEGFQRAAAGSVNPSWPLTVMVESGVQYMYAIEEYEATILHSDHIAFGDTSDPLRLERFGALVGILKYWITQAETNHGNVRDQISVALTTGQLLPRVDGLRARIEEHPQGVSSPILRELERVERSLERLS